MDDMGFVKDNLFLKIHYYRFLEECEGDMIILFRVKCDK